MKTVIAIVVGALVMAGCGGSETEHVVPLKDPCNAQHLGDTACAGSAITRCEQAQWEDESPTGVWVTRVGVDNCAEGTMCAQCESTHTARCVAEGQDPCAQ